MNLSNKQFDFLMGCVVTLVLGFTLTKAYVAEKKERAQVEKNFQLSYNAMITSVEIK